MTEAELKGKVATIDPEKRTITLKDPEGILHPFKWGEPLDVVMRKWKTGYYLTVKYDGEIIKFSEYWQEGKEKFPHEQKGGSARPYNPPRNEKAIMFECALKCMTELYIGGLGGATNGKGFDSVADSIILKAVAATEAGCKVAGVDHD